MIKDLPEKTTELASPFTHAVSYPRLVPDLSKNSSVLRDLVKDLPEKTHESAWPQNVAGTTEGAAVGGVGEAVAAGFAANPKNYRVGIDIGVIGWIGGRVENFYQK